MEVFCTNCGTPLPNGAGACSKCGTKVETSVDPESPKEEGRSTEFTWSHKGPRGRGGSAVITVKLWLEREMLHIQKELSDTITSHKNAFPEETISLANIESVHIQKGGMSVSLALLFLCVVLVLYGGVTGILELELTAICLLGLMVTIALRYRGQMKRYQLVIREKNKKQIVLEGDAPQIMNAAAEAILARTGSTRT